MRRHRLKVVDLKPELILHVGMDKTGTTSIQSALEQAQERLKSEHGVLVPRTGLWSDYSHHPFAFAAFGINGFTAADLADLLARLEEETAGAGCGRVLLSSECLFKLPGHPGMATLIKGLRRIFGPIRVIVYVRRQDRWVDSRYRHSVISGNEIPVARLSGPPYSDYLPYIDRWAGVVGGANVQVRAYETGQFPNGDIAADFSQAAGLSAGALPSLSGSLANVAFSYETVLLRAAFNHLKLPDYCYSGLSETLAAAAAGGPPERSFVSPQLARQLVARYAESNRQIALKYMDRPDGVLFHEAAPRPSDAYVAPAIAKPRLLEILGAVNARAPEVLRLAAAAGSQTRVADLPFRDAAAPVWDLVDALRDLGLVREDEGAKPKEEAAPQPPLARLRDRLVILPSEIRFRAQMLLTATWQRGRPLNGKSPAAPSRTRPGLAAPASVTGAKGKAQEILVHFGIFKTGTTSIQQTLFDHAAGLSGCAYLDAGVPNHSLLVRTAVLDAKVSHERFAPQDSPERFQKRKVQAAKTLARALAAAAPAGRVIVSAETICGFTTTELETLRDFLIPHSDRIRFLGYMRDPVTLTASVFQEQIKSRMPEGFTFGQLGEQGPPRLYGVVDRLDALFGPEAVTVYPFDPAAFPGGDVVRHFLSATGIQGVGLQPVRKNESLSLLAVKALYCFRSLRDASETPKLGESRLAFIADLRGLKGPSFGFHPDVTARIRANSGDWDEWAARRLGGPFVYPAPKADGGVRTEADLITFSDEERAELSRYGKRHGIDSISARSGAEDVAELVRQIRLRFAQGLVQ